MSIDLEGFLSSAVAELCRVLQLREPSTDIYIEDDPVVRSCVTQAYAQLIQFTHRYYARDTFTELYKDIDDYVILLRNLPIISILSIEEVSLYNLSTKSLLVVEEDYQIIGKKIQINPDSTRLLTLPNSLENAFIMGSVFGRRMIARSNPDNGRAFRVVYKGGVYSSDEIPIIQTALVTQGIVNWNRKDSMGMWTVGGAQGGGELKGPYDPNTNRMIDQVKDLLYPYVYCGSVESENDLF